MMRAASALWRHLGWRGLALAGVGACWALYGVGLLVTVRGAVTAGTSPLLRVMCIEAWAGVWIACGALAMAAGVMRPGRDVWGFAAVSLPPNLWALSFATAAVTGQYTAGWAALPVYVAVQLLVVIVAEITGRRRRCECEGAAHGV